MSNNQTKHSFFYGDQRIEFQRKLTKNNTNKVRITIDAQGNISVFAPQSYPENELIILVQQRSSWIVKKLKNIEQNIEQLPPRQYTSGETHYYLGKQYQLKILNNLDEKPSVKLFQGRIYINTHSKEKAVIKKLLKTWYKQRAEIIFNQRLMNLVTYTKWVTTPPKLTLRTMKRQWGNCAVNGKVTLNIHLIKASRLCIDYVILHELCHIAEHNHSPVFYNLMSQVMPQWREVKAYLDSRVNIFIVD